MAKILYSALNPDTAKPEQGFVEADSAAHARDQLQARGLTDVKLHQEMAQAGMSAQALDGLSDEEQAELARLQVAFLQRPTLGTMILGILRVNRLWLAGIAVVLLCALVLGQAWLAVAAVLALAAVLLMPLRGYLKVQRYKALLRYFALGQWEEMRQLAGQLRGQGGVSGQLDFDLDNRLACARVHEGYALSEVLQHLEPWRERTADAPGLFEALVALVHAAAGDRQGCVHSMKLAWEKSGHDPARAVDYALVLARFGDAAQARPILESVDVSLLPPYASGFVEWVHGMVQLRAGQQPDALVHLKAASVAMLKMAAQQPAVWTALAACTCDYAIALNLAGRRDEALQQMRHVEPIVRAHADLALLRMLYTDGLLTLTDQPPPVDSSPPPPR